MKRSIWTAMALVACVACGGTYTWKSGASGTWDTTSVNWNDGTDDVKWSDGNDAVFGNTSAITITVSGTPVARDITQTGGGMTFNGTGSLSWTGWLTTKGTTTFAVPLTDNGGGLRFDFSSHTYFNTANTHTGGTYLRSTAGNCAMILRDGGDATFGAVPAAKETNIVVEAGTGNVVFHADSNQDISLHANRTILIKDGATMWVGSHGILRIRGDIRGEYASNGYPTGTRLATYSAYWQNRTYLYGTNYLGRLYVEGDMEIADGQTTLVTAGQGTGTSAALYVMGNGTGYSVKKGHLLVSGGNIYNYQNGYRFHVGSYGQVDIAGGTVSLTAGEYLNALHSPGRTTIRDGGLLACKSFRLEQTATGDGGELFLKTNGTLRCDYIWIDYPNSGKGTVHFDGGRLQSTSGNDIVYLPTRKEWNNHVFRVEAGGAVFDTSNGKDIRFGRPLVSGMGAGETDGGVVCELGNGRSVVMSNLVNHAYTGPTRLVAAGTGADARTLRCRAADTLPAGTSLQLGPGTQAEFGDMAQTVARLEGAGRVVSNALLAVTGAVAPVFDGAYGTLALEKPCSLSGNFELAGDANGCGRLKLEAAGQDISGLALKVADFAALNDKARGDFYQILDAPSGYIGQFAAGNVAAPWHVRYTATAAYLFCQKGTVLVFR